VKVVAALFQIEDDGGVQVSGSGAHHESFQRGEAHGGIDAAALLDGGNGSAVAQVAGDHVGVFGRAFHHLQRHTCHIAMGGAVETIAADAVFLVKLSGDAI